MKFLYYLPTLLNQYFNDETEAGVVRVKAGEGLRQLGLLSQLLVVELDEVAAPTIRLRSPPATQTITLAEGIELQLVQIPAGRFEMGVAEGEGYTSEYPQHPVTIPDFWMGQMPVTQAQYEAVIGRNPATFPANGANRPVETVSWYDAVTFCQQLSKLTGQAFRLPTEAEWEYACRAGTTTPFHCGATITTDYANYRGTDWDYGGQIYLGNYGEAPKGIFREQTTEVGSFPPNAFGLHDMHGNVWEWCLDHWHETYEGAPDDGSAWLSDNENSNRLLRGGSWFFNPWNCRSATRDNYVPGFVNNLNGFRVVCAAPRTL